MTTIKVNAAARTLEMNKSFAKKAYTFGTREYEMLQKARRDYPNFEVVVKAQSSSKTINKFSGLTYDYMVAYIGKLDDEERKTRVLEDYRALRGLDENYKQIWGSANYQEVKEWFLDEFPEVENFGKKYDEMMEKREALKKRLAEKKSA